MGGQFSLKLGECDRIVYQLCLFLKEWSDSSLSLRLRIDQERGGLKAPAAAFVVDERALRFPKSSPLGCALFALHPSHMS